MLHDSAHAEGTGKTLMPQDLSLTNADFIEDQR
jgi:hypothetical protein